jgi:hypothetical protein
MHRVADGHLQSSRKHVETGEIETGGRMTYELPDKATLAKYMHLLQSVLLAARSSSDPEVADLAYAVHNLPDLLLRWKDMDEQSQHGALRRFEKQHPRWAGHFTKTLEAGAPPDWPLKWKKPDE